MWPLVLCAHEGSPFSPVRCCLSWSKFKLLRTLPTGGPDHTAAARGNGEPAIRLPPLRRADGRQRLRLHRTQPARHAHPQVAGIAARFRRVGREMGPVRDKLSIELGPPCGADPLAASTARTVRCLRRASPIGDTRIRWKLDSWSGSEGRAIAHKAVQFITGSGDPIVVLGSDGHRHLVPPMPQRGLQRSSPRGLLRRFCVFDQCNNVHLTTRTTDHCRTGAVAATRPAGSRVSATGTHD